MSETEQEHRHRKEEQKKKLKKRLSLHLKHKERRKKDNMIGLPFIIAFQGDPARPFYCNDVMDKGIHTYELIHKDGSWDKAFARLKTYLAHHVVSMTAKILIYKAGPNDKTDFEFDVVQRLVRIETKMDNQIVLVNKVCEDVKILENKGLAADGERKMLRKIMTGIIAAIGVISTILGIVGTMNGWF